MDIVEQKRLRNSSTSYVRRTTLTDTLILWASSQVTPSSTVDCGPADIWSVKYSLRIYAQHSPYESCVRLLTTLTPAGNNNVNVDT